jgi:hypothetical protein
LRGTFQWCPCTSSCKCFFFEFCSYF